MFAIALAASFDEDRPQLDSAGILLDAWPCPAADGRASASAPGAAAGVLRWAVVERDRAVAPLWDAERQLLFVGDVRLYNRSALARELGLGDAAGDVSDAAIAWAAYLRWGEQSPGHLVGDFAFAVWDQCRRSIFAARDHFGVRPLLYSADSRSAYVATDVRQLLALTKTPLAEINAQTVLERFSMFRRTHGLTYFRNISALPPAHTIVIAPGGGRPRRYWFPSFAARRPIGDDDKAEIRALFHQAVRDRLDSNRAIVAHSSGGFDSSAIVMAADRAYREQPNRPPLVTVSATTLGMPSDDSRYMDAVDRHVQFEGVRWDALQPSLADIEAPVVAYPGVRRGTGGGPRRDLEIARERGARVLLHGFFGDSLMYAFGVPRDMVRARRWRELAGHVASGDGARARARLLVRSMTGFLPPASALRLLSRVDNRSTIRAPRWMGPALRALYPAPAEDLALPEIDWPSHLACELWASMTSPRTATAVDASVAYGIEDGIEVRMPYLDVRLAEKLLAISSEPRWTEGADHRRLNREVLGPLLPEEFSQRRAQGSWMPVWLLGARRMLPSVQRIFADGPWLSAPFLDIEEARSMLADVIARAESAEQRKLFLVTGFGALEAWLRELFRYDTARYV